MDIRRANQSDLPAVANLLGSVFSEDPVLLEYIGKRPDPRRVLTQIFTWELEDFYLPHGAVDVAEEDGTLLGVALWAPPGASAGLGSQLRRLPGLARLLGRGLPRALRLQNAWAKATPNFPHWYLYTLATAPEARGNGVGSALLDSGLNRAGSNAIYLEATSERAASLYERSGFVRLGRIPTKMSALEIGMWRPQG